MEAKALSSFGVQRSLEVYYGMFQCQISVYTAKFQLTH